MSEIEWQKLPPDLQYRFLAEASNEATRISRMMDLLKRQVEEVKEEIRPYLKQIAVNDDVPVVGAVDGSRSVTPSMRLGAVYSVVAAYFLSLKGSERAGEDGLAAQLRWSESDSRRSNIAKLEALMTLAERTLALEKLSSVNYMLIDGTFFGYLRSAVRAQEEGLMDRELKGWIDEISEKTMRLVESKRAFAVVKRSRTRALVGHLYRAGRASGAEFRGAIDKLLLTLAMPEGSYLRYDMLDSEHPVLLTVHATRHERGADDYATIKENAERPYKSFSVPTDYLYSIKRVQVKAYRSAPVCEMEYPDGSWESLERLIGSRGFFNEATGLPLISDMVDSLVTIPHGFIDEYVEEVMAKALESSGGDALDLYRAFFFSMNPQKPY